VNKIEIEFRTWALRNPPNILLQSRSYQNPTRLSQSYGKSSLPNLRLSTDITKDSGMTLVRKESKMENGYTNEQASELILKPKRHKQIQSQYVPSIFKSRTPKQTISYPVKPKGLLSGPNVMYPK
jgi:hypothetical protein